MGVSLSVGLVRIIAASNCGCICNLDGHHQAVRTEVGKAHIPTIISSSRPSLLREVFITNQLRHQPPLEEASLRRKKVIGAAGKQYQPRKAEVLKT